MITRVQDLKGAFISCCDREGGLPLGRTAFQDFEIAYFLNIAYDQCVKKRVDALAQGYKTIEQDNSRGEVVYKEHHLGHIISELGGLYFPQAQEEQFYGSGYLDSQRWKSWGPNSRLFEVRLQNGVLPWVIGAQLHEVRVVNQESFDKNFKDILQDRWGVTFIENDERFNDEGRLNYWMRYVDEMSVGNKAWPVRLLEGSQVLEQSLYFQQTGAMIDRLPYRVGKYRTLQMVSWSKALDEMLEEVRSGLDKLLNKSKEEDEKQLLNLIAAYRRHEEMYCIEVLHPITRGGHTLYLNIETVRHPDPIKESDIKGGKDTGASRQIEVSFGWEIADVASQLAMRALTGHGQKPQPGE